MSFQAVVVSSLSPRTSVSVMATSVIDKVRVAGTSVPPRIPKGTSRPYRAFAQGRSQPSAKEQLVCTFIVLKGTDGV